MQFHPAYGRLCVAVLLQSHAIFQQSAMPRKNAGTLLVFTSRGLHSGMRAQQKGQAESIALSQDAGFLKRLLRRTGWLDHSRSKLRVSGYVLYENVADRVDYSRFFRGNSLGSMQLHNFKLFHLHLPTEFGMSDTFLSWFVITELHMWMLMVRVMAEGKEGTFVRNCMVRAMWDDATVRAKKLEEVNPAGVREQLNTLSEEFQASLFGYDEGLLADDKVLAGAIWRRFFQLNCSDPQCVESLVQFVRQQVR
ncbi:hypothetical protein PR048_007046 [Dryococelus australis]|uniref:Ubiquinol-cytochrome c chaperone domain-containing protein n=1 Tax=Dryococelus australis TaxID=614101 RepID=A0ABQ9ICK1_9NEOP|nr:hypothetical protein PR048_007046 [Dryococelus australis]